LFSRLNPVKERKHGTSKPQQECEGEPLEVVKTLSSRTEVHELETQDFDVR
jgi:hypothetical protein